ncbi:MAG: CHASE4 domain protein [Methanoregula sp. PtaU1.Bin051]|nr:MAG: CHASE4 domain protein [Methanoregula sp. PtaU1.Bin051]
MEIRTKTILILCLTLVTLIIVIAIASEILVAGGFARVEDQIAEKDTHRALVALADDVNSLDAVAADWAARDSIKVYLFQGSDGSTASPLDDSTFELLAFNYIIISDQSGLLIAGRGYDLEQHRSLPIPSALSNITASSSPLRGNGILQNGTLGIVQTPTYPLLVAVRPIYMANKTGIPAGYITMARHLDDREVIRLSNMTELELNIRPFSLNGPDSEIDALLFTLSPGGGRFLERSGEDSIEMHAFTFRQKKDADFLSGFALIRDIYGDPALVLMAEIPRHISKFGTSTTLYFLTFLLITGIGVGIVIIILLERAVLSRLLSLSSHISSIGKKRDFSARVIVPGNDEITDLATNVNSMLCELEQSQLHLQVRLSQSEENYRLFFNSIIDMVVVLRPGHEEVLTSTIIEANDSAVDCLGGTRKKLMMMPFSDLLVSDEHSRVAAFLDQVRKDQKGRIETLYQTCTGRIIPVEMNVRAFDQYGLEALLIIARDITERRNVEQLKKEAFQQIEKNMEQLATLNDQIRNPLQAIIGIADLIQNDKSEKIIQLAHTIDDIVDTLDKRYLESEKIRDFLRKYYDIDKK